MILPPSCPEREERMISKEDLEFRTDSDGYITNVLLPLTPSEWFESCTRDGEFYMGGCCGSMSYAQDILNSFFRDNGWAAVRDLAQYVETMRSHDGFSKEDLHDPQGEEKHHPIARIIAVWDLIFPDIKPAATTLLEAPRPAEFSDAKEALYALTRGAWALSWSLRFSAPDDDLHTKVDTIFNLMKVIPAFNTLTKKLNDLIPEPIRGFAIYSKGALMETSRGFAIYDSEEKAEEVLSYWCGKEDVLRENFEIRHILLSVEKGIQELNS